MVSKIAAEIHTQFREFDANHDDWIIYGERLEEYFKAHEIKEELQTSTLLSLIGLQSYKLLRDLCFPDKPRKKSFKYLNKLFSSRQNSRRGQGKGKETLSTHAYPTNQNRPRSGELRNGRRSQTRRTIRTRLQILKENSILNQVQNDQNLSKKMMEDKQQIEYKSCV